MVSKPPFEVNIKKASGQVLSFQCDFYEEAEFQDESINKEQEVGGRCINRGSYMSAHVLLNLLNELRKRDKM